MRSASFLTSLLVQGGDGAVHLVDDWFADGIPGEGEAEIVGCAREHVLELGRNLVVDAVQA